VMKDAGEQAETRGWWEREALFASAWFTNGACSQAHVCS